MQDPDALSKEGSKAEVLEKDDGDAYPSGPGRHLVTSAAGKVAPIIPRSVGSCLPIHGGSSWARVSRTSTVVLHAKPNQLKIGIFRSPFVLIALSSFPSQIPAVMRRWRTRGEMRPLWGTAVMQPAVVRLPRRRILPR